MIVAAGVAVGSLLFVLAPALIRFMGAEGEFATLAVQYLRVYALCSPVTTIIFAMDNYLRICGKVRSSMMLNIVMSVLSAGLEFTFLAIFRWGIWGAALATCLGMSTCALTALAAFARGKMQLRFCRPRFSAAMVRQIVACGTPNFLNNIAGRITSILMNFLLIRFGGQDAVSIYGILMYVEGFIQPLLYGMCDSLQPAVGYNWGAGALKRVKDIEKRCFTAGAILFHRFRRGHLLLPASHCQPVYPERRPGAARHGGSRAEAFQFSLFNPLVFLCHPELYVRSGKACSRYDHLRLHGSGLPSADYRSTLAYGPERTVAQCPGNFSAGSDSGILHPEPV